MRTAVNICVVLTVIALAQPEFTVPYFYEAVDVRAEDLLVLSRLRQTGFR